MPKCCRLQISVTTSQVNRWDRHIVDAKRRGETHVGRSQEIRRDGKCAAMFRHEMVGIRNNIQLLAELVRAGVVMGESGRREVLAIGEQIGEMQRKANDLA